MASIPSKGISSFLSNLDLSGLSIYNSNIPESNYSVKNQLLVKKVLSGNIPDPGVNYKDVSFIYLGTSNVDIEFASGDKQSFKVGHIYVCEKNDSNYVWKDYNGSGSTNIWKGVVNITATTPVDLPTTAQLGDQYRVAGAGKYTVDSDGGKTEWANIGDFFFCSVASSSTEGKAAVFTRVTSGDDVLVEEFNASDIVIGADGFYTKEIENTLGTTDIDVSVLLRSTTSKLNKRAYVDFEIVPDTYSATAADNKIKLYFSAVPASDFDKVSVKVKAN